jgi:hypothetical protein
MTWLRCEVPHLTEYDWLNRQRACQLRFSCILQLVLPFMKISNLHRPTMANLQYHLLLIVSLPYQKAGPHPWKEQPLCHLGSKQDLLAKNY